LRAELVRPAPNRPGKPGSDREDGQHFCRQYKAPLWRANYRRRGRRHIPEFNRTKPPLGDSFPKARPRFHPALPLIRSGRRLIALFHYHESIPSFPPQR
jgi:hypothetical protein